MNLSSNRPYRFCERAGRNVFLDQSEGACREYNQCSDAACPHESELGQGRFARVFKLLVPALQDARRIQPK